MEVGSLSKAVRLLQALGDAPGAVGVSELGRRLDIDKASVSRMLRTLERAGFVAQDPVSQRFTLGVGIGVLGYKALRRLDLRAIARPTLEAIAQATGECSHLAILAGGSAFYVDQAVPEQGIVVDAPIGTLAPLHCTALGKVLLAWQPPRIRDELLAGLDLKPFTRRTITERPELEAHLSTVASRGVGFDDEEFSVGVRCIAFPVFRHDGDVAGAIGVSGPSPRVTDDRLEAWETLIRERAAALSAALGHETLETPTPG